MRATTTTTHPTDESFAETRIIIEATLNFLSDARFDSQRLRSMLYPHPCAGLYGRTDSFWPKSPSLQNDLQSFASYLDRMIVEFDGAERRLRSYNLSAWLSGNQDVRHIAGGLNDISACLSNYSPACEGYLMPDRGEHITNRATASAEQYRRFANKIRETLQVRVSETEGWANSDSGTLMSVSQAFPAWYLAYRNRDRDMAVKLWYEADRDAVDLLGRTLPLLAAEAGDFFTLQSVGNNLGFDILHKNVDRRNLSVCALAMCARETPYFTYLEDLLEQRRWTHPFFWSESEPSDLDVALQLGSKPLVEKIVEKRIVYDSFARYTRKAIELGRADIAQIFVPWLDEAERNSQSEVKQLAELAREVYQQLKKQYRDALKQDPGTAFNIHHRHNQFPELMEALDRVDVRETSARQITSDIAQACFYF